MKNPMPRVVPRPDQVRRVPNGFGWIDQRLRRDGFLAELTLEDLAVYVFLVLAARPDGVSWYRKETISATLALNWDQFELARERLVERELIAFLPIRGRDRVLIINSVPILPFRFVQQCKRNSRLRTAPDLT